MMITITETPMFIKKAEKLMSEEERAELINYVAANPKEGDVMANTGGVRKLRFARKGQGKSGSYRVVYYYYNPKNPVFMFTVFGKNEKANLVKADRNTLSKLVKLLTTKALEKYNE